MFSGATAPLLSLDVVFSDRGTGRAGDPRTNFDCGGGVGSALEGMAGELAVVNVDRLG